MTAERIRDLNDAFRRSFAGGRVMTTAGVAAMSEELRSEVFGRVRGFETFAAENDPHGERDFGSFEVGGQKLFWKIDLYEEPGVKDADGEPLTTRVLTIMLAEEW